MVDLLLDYEPDINLKASNTGNTAEAYAKISKEIKTETLRLGIINMLSNESIDSRHERLSEARRKKIK